MASSARKSYSPSASTDSVLSQLGRLTLLKSMLSDESEGTRLKETVARHETTRGLPRVCLPIDKGHLKRDYTPPSPLEVSVQLLVLSSRYCQKERGIQNPRVPSINLPAKQESLLRKLLWKLVGLNYLLSSLASGLQDRGK